WRVITFSYWIRTPIPMTEDLEQLLKNLKLRRMLSVYDEQLRAAEKAETSYSEFVARVVACAMARPAGQRSGVAHPQSESAGTLVAGIVSLGAPARSESQTAAHLRRTRLRRQTREPGVHGADWR